MDEAASYFEYQVEEELRDKLFPYDVYREIQFVPARQAATESP